MRAMLTFVLVATAGGCNMPVPVNGLPEVRGPDGRRYFMDQCQSYAECLEDMSYNCPRGYEVADAQRDGESSRGVQFGNAYVSRTETGETVLFRCTSHRE